MNLDNFLNSNLPELGYWAYCVVFLMTFLEASAFVGLLVPGEVTLLIAGLLVSRGLFNLPALIVVAAIGAILGDSAGYFIGRYGGLRFIRRYGRYFFFKEEYLEITQKYFLRHGGKTILFGRFIGVLRSLAPVVAGISRMPYGSFLLYNITGGILSVTLIVLLGYFFGESWQLINKWMGWGGAIVFATVVVAAIALQIFRRWRRSQS